MWRRLKEIWSDLWDAGANPRDEIEYLAQCNQRLRAAMGKLQIERDLLRDQNKELRECLSQVREGLNEMLAT